MEDGGVRAQFDSYCDYCDEDIEEGADIRSNSKFGWIHKECNDAETEGSSWEIR